MYENGLAGLTPEQQKQYLDSVRDMVWKKALANYYKKVIIEERAPCGTAYTIEYYDEAGELLKRDILVSATEPLQMQSATASEQPTQQSTVARVGAPRSPVALVHPADESRDETQELARLDVQAPIPRQSNQR
jgi:hypothetical protein